MESMSDNYSFKVYITHFTPPKTTFLNKVKDFILPRCNTAYLRSWARLLKHRTRGHQPWKKDVMTQVRANDYPNRYKYLSKVLDELASLKVNQLVINIFSNSNEVELELAKIGNYSKVKFHYFTKYNKMNVFNNSPWVYDDERSPWLLTWEHKSVLKRDLIDSDKNTLFLYIENDMKFTQVNLDYWLKAKSQLAGTSLIPSFVRIEESVNSSQWVAIDHFGGRPSTYKNLPKYSTADEVYVQLDNPYCACYLLDKELATEFVNSKAFDEKTSRELTWWDIGARAAMGLGFVNPPTGFKSRHVVPVKKADNYYQIKEEAKLHHLPNIYSQVVASSNNYLVVDKIIIDE
jgi:hypothetical protein